MPKGFAQCEQLEDIRLRISVPSVGTLGTNLGKILKNSLLVVSQCMLSSRKKLVVKDRRMSDSSLGRMALVDCLTLTIGQMRYLP
jgi:hypothetical protein